MHLKTHTWFEQVQSHQWVHIHTFSTPLVLQQRKQCFCSIVVLFAFIIIWCYFAFMPHYTISFLSLSLSLRVALIGLNSIDVLARVGKADLASTKTEVIWQINGPHRQPRRSPTNTVGTAPMFLHSKYTRRLLTAGQDLLVADENWKRRGEHVQAM